jgi:hypothetical protein
MNLFKLPLSASIVLFASISGAKVPYAQLEKLRQESVVVRVILDNPTSKLCKVDTAMIGQNLQMKIDGASGEWGKVTLTASDLAALTDKVNACAARGSCQVYDEFLGTVKAEDAIKDKVTALKSTLDEKLSKLTAEDYRKALATVPNPCGALK